MKKLVKWILILIPTLAAILYLVLLAGLWAVQDRLMFGRADAVVRETPDARGWPFEEVWCDVGNEKTHGWWIPLENGRGAVLFAHGSGRNISAYLEDVALYREAGLSVLLYDYGGYGASSGTASEERCYADARAVWDYLVNVKKISPDHITLAGSSMGGGVTMGLATQVSPGCLILESTFTSIPDVLSDTYPFIPAGWICHIQFRNIDKIGQVHCPVMVVSSRDDTVVPFAQGRKLFERANEPKMFVEISGAHYGGKFDSKDIYMRNLEAFLAQCYPPR